MINLFQFAPEDKSLDYLSQIFGTMNGVIPVSNSPSGNTLGILSPMFTTFNTIILAVGVLIVIYVTVVGVMATAHEGEFMGKKWSSLWVPIRIVLGIAALVPSGAGYSFIQLVMMWVIVQGIGAADTLWNTVLGHVQVVGSPNAQLAIPTTAMTQTIGDLFKGLVCDETARRTDADPSSVTNGGYYCKSGDAWCSATNTFQPDARDVTYYTLGPSGQCGTLNYCNLDTDCAEGPDSLKCLSCTAQRNALAQIIPTLRAVARKFAALDYQYRDFYANSYTRRNETNPDWQWIYDYCAAQPQPIPQNQCVQISGTAEYIAQMAGSGAPGTSGAMTFPSPNNNDSPQNPSEAAVKTLYWPFGFKLGSSFIKANVSYYQAGLSDALSKYIASVGMDPDKLTDPSLKKAATVGWIFAGSYYYVISEATNKNFQNAMPTFSMSVTDPGQTCSGGGMSCYRNNFAAAGMLLGAASDSSSSPGVWGSVPQLSSFKEPMGDTLDSLNQNFASTITPGGANPLAQLQGFGTALLVIVEILYPILLAITITLGIAANFDVFVLGTGADNPMSGTFIMVYMVLFPALFGLMGIMITGGALLAVYLPLVPYVVFTFGAIGWLISTIETMVAGPLVALGILSPTGQHELLGNAQNALMLLFNVFLRPSLMIFGLIAAMLLATVVASMINYAFWTTVAEGIGGAGGTATNSGGIWGDPLELVIFFCAYIMLMVAALNKCFAAIHIIPERVMRWIGGQGEQYGETEAVGEVKGAVQSGGAAAKGGAEGLRGKGQKAANTEGQRRRFQGKTQPGVQANSESTGDGGGGGGDEGGG